MGRVEGKVAFVTGAARGQGRAHAVLMAKEGADIIAVDSCTTIGPNVGGTIEDFEETVRQVEATGRKISWSQTDIRDCDGLAAAAQKGVDEFGRLDIVVCNAAISSGGPATELSEEWWQDMIDVNLTGQWKTCKATIPHLQASGGGAISITGSFASRHGLPTGVSYCSAKHGLVGMMRVLAVEYAPDIRVNIIHPSNVATPMLINEQAFKHFRPDLENPTLEDFEEAAKRVHLLDIPYLQPEDIANAALFLNSDEGRYITGIEMPVDGGADAKPF